MIIEHECVVESIERLRYPRVRRIKAACGERIIEFEAHEDVFPEPRQGSKIVLSISDAKEECLKHHFCGKGYVVSSRWIGDQHRVVISIGGYLLVVKGKAELALEPMTELFVGASPKGS